jgi:DNA-directed RNA polymerase specialized sigma24 family protein
MPGIPCDQVLAIVRLRQWAVDRQALKTAKTTDYRRTGWTQRNHRAADARLVRVLSFEQAFSRLSQDEQAILAATYRDNLDQATIAALLNSSPRKVNYLLPAARSRLADPQPPRPAVSRQLFGKKQKYQKYH